MDRKTYISIMMLSLLLLSCGTDDQNSLDDEIHILPTFVMELKPVDDIAQSKDVSFNVIQGMAPFEDGWFVTQTSSNTVLLINYLDPTGNSLFHQRLDLDSHGQDLSLEQITDTELNMYTTIGDFDDNRSTGVIRLKVSLPSIINGVRDWSQTNITIDKEFDLNYTHATPSINEEKDQLAIRSNNTILVHLIQEMESNNMEAMYHFALNTAQLKDNEQRTMWFQGIAMKDDLVYCLTGNNKLSTHKKIFSYELNGKAVNKWVMDMGDFEQEFDEKFEPEALAFVGEVLYFTLMTKDPSIKYTGNIKYLYKINI